MLTPTRHVLFGHLLEHGRADRESLAARSVEIALQLLCADEAVLPPQHLQREIIAVVPYEIHGTGHLGQPPAVLILDTQSKDADWGLTTRHTGHA